MISPHSLACPWYFNKARVTRKGRRIKLFLQITFNSRDAFCRRCKFRKTVGLRFAPAWNIRTLTDLWWHLGFPWLCIRLECIPRARSSWGICPCDSPEQTLGSPGQRVDWLTLRTLGERWLWHDLIGRWKVGTFERRSLQGPSSPRSRMLQICT